MIAADVQSPGIIQIGFASPGQTAIEMQSNFKEIKLIFSLKLRTFSI